MSVRISKSWRHPIVATQKQAAAVLVDRALRAGVESAETQEPIAPGHAATLMTVAKAAGIDPEDLFNPVTIEERVEAARHAVRHLETGPFAPAVAPRHPDPPSGSTRSAPSRA